MSLAIRPPTANETPDTGQGGTSAVTTPSNTGHAATSCTAVDGAEQIKSCRWLTFQAPAGTVLGMVLKADYTVTGSVTGGGTLQFNLQYSLNSGSSWNSWVQVTQSQVPVGPITATQTLSAGQAITQVQVRDTITAATVGAGDTADITATVANIKLEITLADGNILVMM